MTVGTPKQRENNKRFGPFGRGGVGDGGVKTGVKSRLEIQGTRVFQKGFGRWSEVTKDREDLRKYSS